MIFEKMSCNYSTATQSETIDKVVELIDKARKANPGGVPVVLCSDVALMRQALSDKGKAFGVCVENIDSWIAELWGLYGTGGTVPESFERVLLMGKVMAAFCAGRNPKEVLFSNTVGTARMLVDIAAKGLPQCVEATSSEDFSEGELQVLAVLKAYAEELKAHNYVEVSQAASLLAKQCQAGFSALPSVSQVIAVNLKPQVNYAQGLFLAALTQVGKSVVTVDCTYSLPEESLDRAGELTELLSLLFRSSKDTVQPTGAVEFVLPAGAYAGPALLASRVQNYVEENPEATFAVGAFEPFELFSQVAPVLEAAGLYSAVKAQEPLCKTGIWQVLSFLAYYADESCESEIFPIRDQDLVPRAIATDFLVSPYAGLSRDYAFDIDANFRKRRAIDTDYMVRYLTDPSHSCKKAADLISWWQKKQYFEVFAYARSVANAAFDASHAILELHAIDYLESALFSAEKFGTAHVAVLRACMDLAVRFGASNAPEGTRPSVVIVDGPTLAGFQPCSYDAVLLTDLDASTYPVKSTETPADLLLVKLGFEEEKDALLDARQQLFKQLSVARAKVILERPLNNENAEEAFACTMFDEITDCYRADTSSDKDLDKRFKVPDECLPYAFTESEGALQRNASLPLGELPGSSCALSSGEILNVPQAAAFQKGYLSPSDMERYIQCPYRWFLERGLKVEQIDAQFGPLETGSFVHACLQEFHSRLTAAGMERVTAENLSKAYAIMDEVFVSQKALQKDLPLNKNPLIPITPLEKKEMDGYQRALHKFVKFESGFLKGFTPKYFELPFGRDNVVEYAGYPCQGTIDRIDVDSQGHAVIIDYKGRLSGKYNCFYQEEVPWAGGVLLPTKIQAAMYATVVQRELGLTPVATFYVSYTNVGTVNGVYNQEVLGPVEIGASLPKAQKNEATKIEYAPGLSAADFDNYLATAELNFKSVVEQFKAGFIGRNPRVINKKCVGCDYCILENCPGRLLAQQLEDSER